MTVILQHKSVEGESSNVTEKIVDITHIVEGSGNYFVYNTDELVTVVDSPFHIWTELQSELGFQLSTKITPLLENDYLESIIVPERVGASFISNKCIRQDSILHHVGRFTRANKKEEILENFTKIVKWFKGGNDLYEVMRIYAPFYGLVKEEIDNLFFNL